MVIRRHGPAALVLATVLLFPGARAPAEEPAPAAAGAEHEDEALAAIVRHAFLRHPREVGFSRHRPYSARLQHFLADLTVEAARRYRRCFDGGMSLTSPLLDRVARGADEFETPHREELAALAERLYRARRDGAQRPFGVKGKAPLPDRLVACRALLAFGSELSRVVPEELERLLSDDVDIEIARSAACLLLSRFPDAEAPARERWIRVVVRSILATDPPWPDDLDLLAVETRRKIREHVYRRFEAGDAEVANRVGVLTWWIDEGLRDETAAFRTRLEAMYGTGEGWRSRFAWSALIELDPVRGRAWLESHWADVGTPVSDRIARLLSRSGSDLAATARLEALESFHAMGPGALRLERALGLEEWGAISSEELAAELLRFANSDAAEHSLIEEGVPIPMLGLVSRLEGLDWVRFAPAAGVLRKRAIELAGSHECTPLT